MAYVRWYEGKTYGGDYSNTAWGSSEDGNEDDCDDAAWQGYDIDDMNDEASKSSPSSVKKRKTAPQQPKASPPAHILKKRPKSPPPKKNQRAKPHDAKGLEKGKVPQLYKHDDFEDVSDHNDRGEVEDLLDEWVQAKRGKDFEKADALRAQLRDMGINAEKERPPGFIGKTPPKWADIAKQEDIEIPYAVATCDGNRKKRKALLQEHVVNQETEVEVFVPVPKRYIPKVIGKSACEIQNIKKQSRARVVDARDQRQDPVQVRIVGSPDAVDKAALMIMDILDSLENRFADAEYIDIPAYRAKQLIGEKGHRMRELQEKLGVKIDVADYTDGSNLTKVYIRGENEHVEKAKETLLAMSMIDAGSAAPGFDDADRFEMPHWGMGVILGKNGLRVRELQSASGASIDVEKKNGRCHVRVGGTPEQINSGVEAIYEMLQRESPAILNDLLHYKANT